jgi:anti-sigma factor RsiW
LLAAIRGEGAPTDRHGVLDRTLRCPACQREIALLHAVSGLSEERRSAIPRIFTWQRLVSLAAAASILIAVGIIQSSRQRCPPVGTGKHRWWVRAHLEDGGERRSVAWILRVP